MTTKRKHQPPYLGAAYYPEAWPLELIDEDIKLMLKAGMNVMRIGEFAWQRMEPQEGQFDFAWLHLVVDKLGKAGIATILGTPTPTPPAWLTERYPEVLVVMDAADGVRAQHGGRVHFCPNNAVYRDLCARIVTRMGEEFGRDSNVIGWQIDNEVYPWWGRGCRCPVCERKFREWLLARYGTIGKLNSIWGMGVWSLAYQSFEQIRFPRQDTWHHPSHKGAWAAFQSDTFVDYVMAQANILKKLTRNQPIGTDMMPLTQLDHRAMNLGLDVAQFNHYHGMGDLCWAPLWFDYFRSLKSRPFWNTETATCWNGSTAANGYREPGFNRVNSWMPIALGGEANLYWLWRVHWSGQELMHGSVVSSCGRPLHMFGEVQEISRGFKVAAKFLNGTRPVNHGMALHFSTSAHEMFGFQPMVKDFNYLGHLLNTVYRPLLNSHLRPDVIHPAADLDPYRVVFSPYLPALDQGGLRERLLAWIRAGGTWIAGPFTDVRTLDGTKYTHAPFGSLEKWGGVRCKYEIPGDPRGFKFRWADGRETKGSIWHYGFELRGAEALATFTDNELDGLAAVTRRRLGKGQIILLGTMPSVEDLQRLLLEIAGEAGVKPVAEASPNVLAVPRAGKAGKGMVVIEYEHKAGSLTLPRPMTDLLTGKRHSGVVELAPYSVMVLKG